MCSAMLKPVFTCLFFFIITFWKGVGQCLKAEVSDRWLLLILITLTGTSSFQLSYPNWKQLLLGITPPPHCVVEVISVLCPFSEFMDKKCSVGLLV